jgi:hypothetical protein
MSQQLSEHHGIWPDAPSASASARPPVRTLSEADAIELWLARWLKTPRKIIRQRYACDPRRIYEVWEGTRFPGSRAKALERLRAQYPGLADQVDVSRHRRIARGNHPGQMSLFD